MNRRNIRFLALLIPLLFVGGLSVAQDPEDIQQGIKAYGSYRGGDIDTVSMTSGNVYVHIPLISYPQRGKLRLSYSLIFNSSFRTETTTCGLNGCITNYKIKPSAFANSSSPVVAVADQQFQAGSVQH